MLNQLSLFKEHTNNFELDVSEFGTFKDCLREPIYRWFTYPAGFSFKAPQLSFIKEKLKSSSIVYDPFMGSGTTNLTAKIMGINSVGVEAHPLVFNITKCKLLDDINERKVIDVLRKIEKIVKNDSHSYTEKTNIISKEFPELILKCFLPETLFELLLIRNHIRELDDRDTKLFLNTGLICCLRIVSIAATGWPYIAPNKIKVTSLSKNGIDTYINFIYDMLADMKSIKDLQYKSYHNILLNDSRNTTDLIDDESIDHIFTSPPYLNNFDYADRTRLEMYFMGDANNWHDICLNVRTKLITSATTQINRSDVKYKFSEEFIAVNKEEYRFLSDIVFELSKLRKTKGGKKSYDLLVVGYFNDIFRVLRDNFRVLKNNSTAKYILGDSAPYGIYVPTDELIGKIGLNIGFKKYSIDILRKRGEKWKNNPQRHNVSLRESLVTLYK